jgi:pseudouridine kinase
VYVTVIGGCNVDIKGCPEGDLLSETSNPGKVTLSAGGVGRNIAHNLALLDVPVYFLGAVGDDGFGTDVLHETRCAGVDVQHMRIVQGVSTGMYLSILNQQHDLAVAIADMESTRYIDREYIAEHKQLIQKSNFVVLETNLGKDVLYDVIELCRCAHVPYLVEPVSVTKSKKLLGIQGRIDYITPNLPELEVLLEKTLRYPEDFEGFDSSLAPRFHHLMVTLGEQGVFYYRSDRGGKHYPAFTTPVIDAHGAGDAFVAGLVCGLFHRYEIEQCIRLGMAAAHLTLQTEATVNTAISLKTCLSLIS